ncbi:MAG: M2 family metallopeptidase [Gemmatimonadetes bacterium]|nr:M2 family metallopeptidase [Gemmatimonadota bacterium]
MPWSVRSVRWAALLGAALLATTNAGAQARRAPTLGEAQRFMARAEAELFDLGVKAGRAEWVAETYITEDTEQLTADASNRYGVAVARLVGEARRFDHVRMPAELRRKFTLLRLAVTAPPPPDTKKAEELSQIGASLTGDYGRGSYCRPKPGSSEQECLQISELSNILATSRDPAQLLDAWQGWHRIGAPMRDRYARFVALSNEGARSMGFANTGAMWRSGYDMTPEQFDAELERLWGQMRPLYVQLHAYVRRKLVERYGAGIVPPNGMIPAHLLGNMWAQEWGNISDIVMPAGVRPSYDLTQLLSSHGYDANRMVHAGENFYRSLGFDSLPPTFWERSQFTKPRDREVVCHASAWDLDAKNDVRIKMCIQVTGEDFVTIHHELGHNFYQRAYQGQPYLFEGGANDGFHEAIGDAIALSITPRYLQQIGLLAETPSVGMDTLLLLRQALDKVAFLPFGLVIDKWRFGVFDGSIPPAQYNAAWWRLRNQYQGVSAPLPRSEADFDPGAKNHIPTNVPYMRYFLARIYQFQFYRGMCRAAGETGPLYRCSVFNSKAAGERLARMLQAGQSKPWQEILHDFDGEDHLDAGAMLEYFQPLQVWLEQQNRGQPVGW